MKVRLVIAALLLAASSVGAQAPAPLFAAVFRTGPNWDQSKPPNEQTFFREHSANLSRLRQAGTLVVGARYAEVGLMVVSAPSEAAARKLFEPDPSIANGTFVLEVHPFSVVYGGTLAR